MPKFKIVAVLTKEITLIADVEKDELDDDGNLDEEAALDYVENASESELEVTDEGSWEIDSIKRTK